MFQASAQHEASQEKQRVRVSMIDFEAARIQKPCFGVNPLAEEDPMACSQVLPLVDHCLCLLVPLTRFRGSKSW